MSPAGNAGAAAAAAVAAANAFKVATPAGGGGGGFGFGNGNSGEVLYKQFGDMVLRPTPRASVTKTATAQFSVSLPFCYRNTNHPALSNYLLLLEGFEISADGLVCEIAHAGDFNTTFRNQRAAYAGPDGYLTRFREYVKNHRPKEEEYIVKCRIARQQFQARYDTYARLLPGVAQRTEETLRLWLSPEHFVVIPAGSDAKNAAALVSAALVERSQSDLAAARAKKKEEIKARTEAMRRRYASGESVGQLVRAGGESRLATAQPPAQKTLTLTEVDQVSDALALVQLGSETGKAAAKKGDKDERKAALAMQRSGAAQIRAVAAGWAGAMTYVNVKTAVAVNVGLIWILDGQCERTVSHPVYVVVDDDNKNWYIVKLDTFNQMRSIGRRTTTRYEATRRVKIAGAGDLPIEVVPLMPSTIYAAAGNTGRESDNLADAYSAQLDVIKFEHGRNTVAAAAAGYSPFVSRSA